MSFITNKIIKRKYIYIYIYIYIKRYLNNYKYFNNLKENRDIAGMCILWEINTYSHTSP